MQEFGIFFPTLAFFLLLVSPVNFNKHKEGRYLMKSIDLILY